jgi:hypothetical protein
VAHAKAAEDPAVDLPSQANALCGPTAVRPSALRTCSLILPLCASRTTPSTMIVNTGLLELMGPSPASKHLRRGPACLWDARAIDGIVILCFASLRSRPSNSSGKGTVDCPYCGLLSLDQIKAVGYRLIALVLPEASRAPSSLNDRLRACRLASWPTPLS